jgi:hypothetical protein
MLRKYISLLILSASLTTVAAAANAQDQDERAYTEGAVVVVSYIRTEPGMFDDYLRYLSTTYKKLMDEYKKSGVIVDYGVYGAEPRNETDPDLILTITYKNFAALDNIVERTDPIDRKIWGTLTKANEASAARGKMRTNVGGQTLRQLILR